MASFYRLLHEFAAEGTMTQNMARKIRFSDGVKARFSDAEREMLAAEFTRHYEKTGQRFIEKPLGVGDVLICDVTPRLFRVMLEDEW